MVFHSESFKVKQLECESVSLKNQVRMEVQIILYKIYSLVQPYCSIPTPPAKVKWVLGLIQIFKVKISSESLFSFCVLRGIDVLYLTDTSCKLFVCSC